MRRLGVPVPAAAAVVGVFAASAPLAAYGGRVYPELPAALAVAVAILQRSPGPCAAGAPSRWPRPSSRCPGCR